MRLREVKMGGKRSIISLIIVCLIGCMLCGCDKKQDTEKEIGKNAPKIVVGSDNYPPFNYMDENGNPTGIDVDIATEAFKRLGYRVEFVNIEWEDKNDDYRTFSENEVFRLFRKISTTYKYESKKNTPLSSEVSALVENNGNSFLW